MSALASSVSEAFSKNSGERNFSSSFTEKESQLSMSNVSKLELFLDFCSMKQLRVLLLPRGMLVQHQVTPTHPHQKFVRFP